MARPLRIQFENAWYHVMNRGAARRSTFSDDTQRELFLSVLGESTSRFGIEIHSYCLMSNHYHLLLKTPFANLSRAMQHIDGVYTQRYNRLMKLDGPLFRGRFKSIVIDAENYLVVVSRYIHRNPVDAGICNTPANYKWSSYPAYIGEALKPEWLVVNEVLSYTNQDIQSFRELSENLFCPSLYEYDLERESYPPKFGVPRFFAKML
jgi:putative transposase